jgi:thiol:disulfide interchange protein
MNTVHAVSDYRNPFNSAAIKAVLAGILLFTLAYAEASPSSGTRLPGDDNVLSANNAPFPGNNSLAGVGNDDFLPVEQAYRLTMEAEGDQLQLYWRIADGYFLYRHGFKVLLGEEDITHQATMPKGIVKQDELFGEVQVYYQQVTLKLPSPTAAPYRLTVQSQGCADAGLCYPPHQEYFKIDPATGQISTAPPLSTQADTSQHPTHDAKTPPLNSNMTLPLAVLFAFLGGLILNLMPCVLPVLSLKALGMASSKDSHIAHGWWYTIGIMTSFAAIAAVLIGLKWAGTAVGWGFQLQSAWFVAGLTYLFFVMALLLIGAANFSGSWMGLGQALTNGGGYRGSFFTGALAVLVASPCTAPFMGTAMGFALAQNAVVALLIFLCLGLGMASPFLLISYLPQAGHWLPAPGQWMERFRQFLAFPLLATAVWLLWIIGRQAGADAVTLVLGGCLLLALALWLNGASLPVKAARLGLLFVAGTMLADPRLGADPERQASSATGNQYSADKVEQLQAEGKAVFVNFTADWCITCLANENWVLSRNEIKQAFDQFEVIYLKADWTNRDPNIAATLEQFGRSGIPLYLFYPAHGEQEAIVLPQILSIELVLKTLKKHSAETTQTANL